MALDAFLKRYLRMLARFFCKTGRSWLGQRLCGLCGENTVSSAGDVHVEYFTSAIAQMSMLIDHTYDNEG